MPDCLFEIAAAEGIGVKFATLPNPLLSLYDSRPGEPPMILLHEKPGITENYYVVSLRKR